MWIGSVQTSCALGHQRERLDVQNASDRQLLSRSQYHNALKIGYLWSYAPGYPSERALVLSAVRNLEVHFSLHMEEGGGLGNL